MSGGSMTIDGNKLMMLLNDWWSSSFGCDEETEDSKAIKTVMDEIEKNLKDLIPESCEDAISREDALKALAYDIESFEFKSGVARHMNEIANLLNTIYEIQSDNIKALPPVQPKPKTGWIPVNEKLPEDRREVFVTAYWHETYQVMMASYYGDGLWWCVPFNNCGEYMQRLNPKAWMPLPEPYKPQERSDKE